MAQRNVSRWLVFLLVSTLIWSSGHLLSQDESLAAPATNVTLYRQLAEQAFEAYRERNSTAAMQYSGILEGVWDARSASIKEKSPSAWESIDRAMDLFIKPLANVKSGPADADQVQTAYASYLTALSRVEVQVEPDRTLTILRSPSGAICIVMKRGTGKQPKLGQIVVLHATGLLHDGTEFYKRRTGADPDWMRLMPTKRPDGVIEALQLLHVGDTAIMIIPASLGYGTPTGPTGNVPPNSILTYLVEVLDVKSDLVTSVMLNTIDASGVDEAVKQYRELRARGFPDLQMDEGQMNALGYRLLEGGNPSGAIKVLQLNAEAYPDSANVYDSLGEAYAKSGQRQEAMVNYKKALSIDPNMASSVKALKEIENK